MKKIILIIMLGILVNGVYSKDLRTLSKVEREKEIKVLCKEAILKYGDSRYWDETITPTIKSSTRKAKNGNREIYIVTYTNAFAKKNMEMQFLVRVEIFADTGKAYRIHFGNMWAIMIPDVKTKNSKPIEKMPFVTTDRNK